MTDLQLEYPDFSTRSLAHLGLNCMGPCRVVDNMISRLCPSSATLSFETTALRRGEGGLYMRTRCISCQTEFDLSNALEKYDLKAGSHDQICENKRCTMYLGLVSGSHVPKVPKVVPLICSPPSALLSPKIPEFSLESENGLWCAHFSSVFLLGIMIFLLPQNQVPESPLSGKANAVNMHNVETLANCRQ
jgi:hypothetical protein